MKKPSPNPFPICFLAALAVIVLVSVQIVKVRAVTCDPSSLEPCAPAILLGTTPTSDCCTNLKAQQPCFCQYANDPNYAQFVNSTNARKAAAYCKVPIPCCPPSTSCSPPPSLRA
ncbi:hypothetical protein MLD38_001228 [Melastoma candidum]|uniref:Uncharacterized protein n=1 Tax=Melastoma candidum TaxID=119954 RepID=A0ACB9SE58_9MYRT|nr:hypothetical protein MLD38_001228 [Melastoma candidum]